MATMTCILKKDAKLTARQLQELEEAEKRPIVYDDDCPELSDEELKRFVRGAGTKNVIA